ncbi:hypothetical protein Taro_022385 [Colocasia esculenta]|uniref:Myb/SANT-like DNA-binding domain-containing protein n=1 Tax=Colocasia esculenta TaxID=4460 RepID=A0A843V1P1_COLES|nr:hypothetical protein [Colocasia esculenta]
MEGNMMPRAQYGVLDIQGSMHMQQEQHPYAPFPQHRHPHQQQQQLLPEQENQHQRRQHQQQLQQQQQTHPSHHGGLMVHPPMHEVSPLCGGRVHDANQLGAPQRMEYNKCEPAKNSTSGEDEASENCMISQHGLNEGKRTTPWQRMKWTDATVRLLITVVSYLGEDAASECNSGMKRKISISQKKGKWKCVSKVMAERGCYISPQQCEDKFNDLNKRYKRLVDILGRGTSCNVVENPALLDLMDHLSEKEKDDVRKILSSKHLFYEEMCSYHNGNRLHLPADPSIQQSLQLALASSDEHDAWRRSQDDLDEDDQGAEIDDGDDEEEDGDTLHVDAHTAGTSFPKRTKFSFDMEGTGYANPLGLQEGDRRHHPQGISLDMNQVLPEGSQAAQIQRQLIQSRVLQLQEEQLHIQLKMLELEMQRVKWQRFNRKKDRELEKLRLENEKMKLENEHLALELKHKELGKNMRS